MKAIFSGGVKGKGLGIRIIGDAISGTVIDIQGVEEAETAVPGDGRAGQDGHRGGFEGKASAVGDDGRGNGSGPVVGLASKGE